ncbi:MAG: HIT domain-containing protein [Bacilli bacterium]|nr:HIT domain-containing protein [Bacilli bacterium]
MERDNMNCIFCKIITGEIPSYTIYEDEFVKVFLDINPDSNGHMLIIPKKHVLDITEIENEIWNHLLDVTKNMKSLLEEKLKIDGLTLIQNNGVIQEVKHFHLHLKPYYKEGQDLLPVEEIYNKLKEL